jgi:hypothetical protein
MGKQVAFYLTPEDTEFIFEKLRRLDSALVIHSRSSTSKPRVINSLNLQEDGRVWLYFFLVQDNAIDDVVMREVPAQGYWTVDSLKSPVIEFTRSFFDASQIRSGRLWYEDSYYDDLNQLVQKPDSFVRWASRIVNNLRKNLQKRGHHYFGSHADELIQSGCLKISR